MTNHEPFLRAVVAQPDEDAPRLIYADWLEEQGQVERAEFIRLQCEITSIKEEDVANCDLARLQVLEDREEELLENPAALGEHPLRDVARHCRYRRGMLDEATLSLGMFLREAVRDFNLVPLRCLTLTHLEPQYLSLLANTSALGRLRSLTLRHEEQVHQVLDLGELLASPYLEGLESLALRNILNRKVGAQSTYTTGPALRELKLTMSGMNRWDLGDFLESPLCRKLSCLHLHGSFGPGLISSLVLMLENGGIEKLTLHGELAASSVTSLSDVDLLLACPALANLKEIRMAGRWLGEAAIHHLTWTEHLRNVTTLGLRSVGISDYAIRALSRAERLPELKFLDLRGNALDIVAIRALAGGPLLGQLHFLGLDGRHLHRQALETLLHSRYWNGKTGLLLTNYGSHGKCCATCVRSIGNTCRTAE